MREKRKRHGRRRYTTEERRRLLEAFDKHGGRAKEFAQERGVGLSTLYLWQRRGRGSTAGKVSRTKFREVSLAAGLGAVWTGEVSLPDGTSVRWNGVAGLAAAERLVLQLRRSC